METPSKQTMQGANDDPTSGPDMDTEIKVRRSHRANKGHVPFNGQSFTDNSKQTTPKKTNPSARKEEDLEENSPGTVRRSARKNKATSFSGGNTGTNDQPTDKKRKPIYSPTPSKRTKQGTSSSNEMDMRILARIIPVEQENEVREQVKKEFANLLNCEESVVPDLENGVNGQIAKANAVWEQNFLEFLVFKKCYGHALVPKLFPENPALGRWTAKNRRWRKTKDKRLTSSRLKRLQACGFVWDAKSSPDFWKIQNTCEQKRDNWEMYFEQLLDYKKKNGDCIVPKLYPENQALSRWVSKQRKFHRAKHNGEYHTLTDEQEKRLIEVGFVFNTKTTDMIRTTVLKRFEGRWERFFDKLLEFKKEFGHCAVPRRWKRDQQLASWVMRQRFHWKKLQRGEHSYMTKERLRRLTESGFVFVVENRNRYKEGHRYQESNDDNGKSDENIEDNKQSKNNDDEDVDNLGDDEGMRIDEYDTDDETDPNEELDVQDNVRRVRDRMASLGSPDDNSETTLVDSDEDNDDGNNNIHDEKAEPLSKLKVEEQDKIESVQSFGEEKAIIRRRSVVDERDFEGTEPIAIPNDETKVDLNSQSNFRNEKSPALNKSTPAHSDLSGEAVLNRLQISISTENSSGGAIAESPTNQPDAHDEGEEAKLMTRSPKDVKNEGSDTAKQNQHFSLKKGIWCCRICGKEEYRNFIEACAHEASCSGLGEIKLSLETAFIE